MQSFCYFLLVFFFVSLTIFYFLAPLCCRLSMRCLCCPVASCCSDSTHSDNAQHLTLLYCFCLACCCLYVSNLQLVVWLLSPFSFLYYKLASLLLLWLGCLVGAKLACSPSFFMSLRISTLSHEHVIFVAAIVLHSKKINTRFL